MTLSFIIPVYNVAPYLRKCVDSLLNQDYNNYEIILVDDGSTDNSGALCDEYASCSFVNSFTHSFVPIRVIHQPNAGLSAARNTGIAAAIGEYICFVDSDDYWQPNVLGGLMEQVQREQLDVLRFDYQNVRLITSKHLEYEIFEPNKYPHQVDACCEVTDGTTYLNTRMGYACYAWQFIIKKSILKNRQEQQNTNYQSPITNEVFTPGIHFEDTEWLPRMMLAAKRVNSTPTIVYNYFVRQGSITQTQGKADRIKKNIEDCITVISQYAIYRKQYPSCQWLRNMQSTMVVSVISEVAQYLYSDRNNYLNRLKSIKVFPLSLANTSKTYLRKARLINLSPRLATSLLHFKNHK